MPVAVKTQHNSSVKTVRP